MTAIDAGCRVRLDEIRLGMDLTRRAGRSAAAEKKLKAQLRRLLAASDARPWVLFAGDDSLSITICGSEDGSGERLTVLRDRVVEVFPAPMDCVASSFVVGRKI